MGDADRERWDARYRGRAAPDDVRGPDPFLATVVGSIPARGRALDVAGGDGRDATWLASRGWDVTLADISAEGLARAEGRARSAGVVVATVRVDLEADPFPAGPWDLVVCLNYLHRPLFAAYAAAVAPGGSLVVVHPTIRNLERSDRPGPRYLLGEGELARLLHGWTIIRIEEGWRPGPPERHEARCLARRPSRDPAAEG